MGNIQNANILKTRYVAVAKRTPSLRRSYFPILYVFEGSRLRQSAFGNKPIVLELTVPPAKGG
jgi:hypothetical protein